MPAEVEKVCLEFEGVLHAKAYGKINPITGQHVEIIIEKLNTNFNKKLFKDYLRKKLPKHMFPLKIMFEKISLSHRFKKL